MPDIDTYKMFNVTRYVTPSPHHIIKHTNLLYLRIDDSPSNNRLELLPLCGWV